MWGRVVDQEIPRNPMCCSSLCKVVGCQTQLTSMKLDSIREIYLKIWKKKHPWESHLFRVSSKKEESQRMFSQVCHLLKTYASSNQESAKGVRVRSFSGPYIPAFGLNTKSYRGYLPIQSKCRKIRTSKTPNTNNF